ncbi:MAG: amidophosphoribosyltransferase, partial [Clostridia bacterium]|nr:amidophosphoribosyltransferase [Clostridia bacterium]
MGGFFGITSKEECLQDVFFGVDYHSHLGTRRAGLAVYDKEIGLQRKLHSIENSPFRTRFENVFDEMHGTAAVGCISNTDPQPLLIRSKGGTFALCTTGIVNNAAALIDEYLEKDGGHFDSMTGGKVNTTELLAALISREETLVQGIKAVQQAVDGTVGIVLLKDDGTILAARDKMGRLPMLIGKREDGYCVTFESFAAIKLGFEIIKELGAGEIVELSPAEMKILAEPLPKKKICAFLWSYYGYPTATYEGVNVDAMRGRNGALMAKSDRENGLAQEIDYVCGIPDSGVPHAIGYANHSHKAFARPFVKYTPTWARSFMPSNQEMRNVVAEMKQIPVPELIEGKKLMLVDDSIVRGTQLRETV